jgi:3-oxoacyl-[acyl-carrier-protein] synthase-3
MSAYIQYLSYYLPDNILTNKELSKISGWKEEDLFNKSGVEKRYFADLETTASDLGNRAAEIFFSEHPSVAKEEVDYLIFISDALDYKGPTSASIMQHKIGLPNHIGSIDILHGCTGYIYGLNLAKALIVSGQAKNVLVITADTPTKVIHPDDIELIAIFSDGAAVTLITENTVEKGLNLAIEQTIFGTDGKGAKNLMVHRSGTREPADIEWLNQFKNIPSGMKWGRMTMNSEQIFLFAFRKVPELIKQILEKNNYTIEEIKAVVPHQANGIMLDLIRKRMRLNEQQFIIDIKDYGNTVSSTIPIALYNYLKNNNLNTFDKLILAGFGIGYSWGGLTIKKV